jgi:hypothetical protein
MAQVWNPFKKFFDEEPEVDESSLDDCRQLVSFGNEPYFEKLIAYLERGADAKIDTSDATTMLTSAARINTFKDIKTHLKRQLKDAVEILDREHING